MNMHEFQRRIQSKGLDNPALILVRKLQSVGIESARRALDEQGAGWIIWNEQPGAPMEPTGPVGNPSWA